MAVEVEKPPITGKTIAHLCIDMQRMFAEDTDWHTPWMKRVEPQVARIMERHPGETIFTRFIPPRSAEDAVGKWRDYYERWQDFTLERIEPALLDVLPALERFAPPAIVLDKPAYSPFHATDLDARLKQRGVDTLVLTGAETDVCVLAAVSSAIDLGYYVVMPKDALCSSADETHDALMTVYGSRFGQQLCVTTVDLLLEVWP